MAPDPTREHSPAGLARDPSLAVSFVRRFDAQEGLSAERLAGKVKGMLADADSFYRATPALFHADLHGAFSARRELLDRPAPRIVIAGDPHLSNFGTFRSADGRAAWGLNDFDQAGTGSPEWDLERLAASAVLVSRQHGLGEDEQQALVRDLGLHYFDTVSRLARAKAPGPAPLGAGEANGPVKELIAKAEAVKRGDFLARYAESSHEAGWRFLSTGELRPVTSERATAIEDALRSYAKGVPGGAKAAVPLRILDVAEKLGSGGSSFGLNRYYALVANADPSKKPVILEVKQLLPSPIETQDGELQRADGAGVVASYRALGALANPLTGATTLDGGAYLVRELEPEKARLTLDKLGPRELQSLCAQAASVLARSHAQGPGQAAAIQAWVKDDAEEATANLWGFSKAYADQTEADYSAFKSAHA